MSKAILDGGNLTMTDLLLSESPPLKGTEGKLPKNQQDIKRIRKHVERLDSFFADVDVICVETPVGSQNAAAMKSYGACVGVLSCLPVPLIYVSPLDVKAIVHAKATKAEMIAAMHSRFPHLPWLTDTQQKLLNKNEHLADSLAAILAGSKTDHFKLLTL